MESDCGDPIKSGSGSRSDQVKAAVGLSKSRAQALIESSADSSRDSLCGSMLRWTTESCAVSLPWPCANVVVHFRCYHCNCVARLHSLSELKFCCAYPAGELVQLRRTPDGHSECASELSAVATVRAAAEIRVAARMNEDVVGFAHWRREFIERIHVSCGVRIGRSEKVKPTAKCYFYSISLVVG